MPLVSVLIPAWNAEAADSLGVTLEALRSAAPAGGGR